MVAWKELAEIGDEEILQAIAVEVHGRHVIGMREARQDRQLARSGDRQGAEQESLRHFGRQQVEPPVAVEIHEAHVRHCGRRRDLRHGQLPVDELDRRLGRVGPRLRRRQVIRRVAEVEGERLLQVVGQRDLAHLLARDLRLRLLLADELHPQELVAPTALRQDVRRRGDVARRARRTHGRVAPGVDRGCLLCLGMDQLPANSGTVPRTRPVGDCPEYRPPAGAQAHAASVRPLVLPDLHPVGGRRRSGNEHERAHGDVDVAVVIEVADVE